MNKQPLLWQLLSWCLISLLLACTPPTAEEQAYARISEAPAIGAIDTFMLDFPSSQLIFKLRPLRDSLIVAHFADCSDCACEELGAYTNQLMSRFVPQLEALYEDCLYQRMQEAPSRHLVLSYAKAFPEGQYATMMKDELAAFTKRVRHTFATNRQEDLSPEIYGAVLALLDYQLAHPEAGILVDFSFKNDYHKWSDYSDAERDAFIELYDFPNNLESLYATPPKSPMTDELPPFDGQTFWQVLDDCELGRALNFQLADAATNYTPDDLWLKIKGVFEIAMLEGTQVPVILPIQSIRQRNGFDQGEPVFEGYRFGLQLRNMVSFQTSEEAAPLSFSFVTASGEYMSAVQESMYTGTLEKPKYNTNYSDRPLYERMEQSMLSRVSYDLFTAMGASVDRRDRLIDDYMESNYYREALGH